ncbi:MAG: hypothetical protein QM757_26155 [Paludibaculum sp.]
MLQLIRTLGFGTAVAILTLAPASCGCPKAPPEASISIVSPPRAGTGGPGEMDDITGTVKGVQPSDARVVIYCYAGDRWWVQPLEDAPFTPITSKLEWSTRTHLGFEYAVLLVHKNWTPPKQPMQLPEIGGCVWALDKAKGAR